MATNEEEAGQGALLAVASLSTGYGDLRVLEGVSLYVKPGETVAVLGPNGHGKTTLLRTVSGLNRAWSGKVDFCGADITFKRPDSIAALGLIHVPQGDMLFANMTVRENLLVGAYLPAAWRERRQRLERTWDIFPHLRGRADQLARGLSGGERRMLALGRALMADAKMLMVDEPSLGLAPIAIESLYETLARLKATGLSVLLVEEVAERISVLADRLYLLDSGRIVMEGPAEELLSHRATIEAYLG